MSQNDTNKPVVNITADDTAFIVDVQTDCFAEIYMDHQPCTYPHPETGKPWSYIKGPATVHIPVPNPGKHDFAVYISGQLIPDPPYEHIFPDPNEKEEPISISKKDLLALAEYIKNMAETLLETATSIFDLFSNNE